MIRPSLLHNSNQVTSLPVSLWGHQAFASRAVCIVVALHVLVPVSALGPSTSMDKLLG